MLFQRLSLKSTLGNDTGRSVDGGQACPPKVVQGRVLVACLSHKSI